MLKNAYSRLEKIFMKKFFDYEDPLFHHLHLSFKDAARVGLLGKPEAYFYPIQYNNYATLTATGWKRCSTGRTHSAKNFASC